MKRLILFTATVILFLTPFAASAENQIPAVSAVNITVTTPSGISTFERLVYISAGQAHESPIWSHDGTKIAFTGRVGMGIWIADADGGEAELIYDNYHEYEYGGVVWASNGSMTPIAFSPDGTEVYFHDWSIYADGCLPVVSDTQQVLRANTNPKIFAVNIKTGEARIVVEKAGWGCMTRDCTTCVYRKMGQGYASVMGIFVLNLETGEEWPVSSSSGSFCLSGDETHVIYSQKKDDDEFRQLYSIPIGGGTSVKLTNFTKSSICYDPQMPQCSRDGNLMVFVAQYPGVYDTSGLYSYNYQPNRLVDHAGLCCMDLSTGTVTRLATESYTLYESTPRFAPDESVLLYTKSTKDRVYGFLAKMYKQDLAPLSLGAATAVADEKPAAFNLAGNYPNPFNPTTTIDFSLATPGKVMLAVYNTTGQLIRELAAEEMSAGHHSVVWDGCDSSGNTVSSGIYLYRLSAGNLEQTKRMTLIR